MDKGDKGRTATAAAEAAAALSGLSGFLLAASGEVESADVDGSREPLMCVLAFTCGDDWALLHGSPSGVTQLACAADGSAEVITPSRANNCLTTPNLKKHSWIRVVFRRLPLIIKLAVAAAARVAFLS